MALTIGIFRIVKKEELKEVGEKKTKILHARVAEDKKSTRGKAPEDRESNFFDITVFGKRAETFDELLEKGDPVFIQGEIENNNYEGKDGTTIYRDQILVDEFRLIESKEAKKVRQRLAEKRKAEAGDLDEGEEAEADEEEVVAPKKKATAKKTATAAKKAAPATKKPAKRKPEPEPEPEYDDDDEAYDEEEDDFL